MPCGHYGLCVCSIEHASQANAVAWYGADLHVDHDELLTRPAPDVRDARAPLHCFHLRVLDSDSTVATRRTSHLLKKAKLALDALGPYRGYFSNEQ